MSKKEAIFLPPIKRVISPSQNLIKEDSRSFIIEKKNISEQDNNIKNNEDKNENSSLSIMNHEINTIPQVKFSSPIEGKRISFDVLEGYQKGVIQNYFDILANNKIQSKKSQDFKWDQSLSLKTVIQSHYQIKAKSQEIDIVTKLKQNTLKSGNTLRKTTTYSEIEKEKLKIPFKKRLIHFVRGKIFDYLIIILVLFYTAIIFVYFALDTTEYENVNDITLTLKIIQYIELGILITFCVEIMLKVYVESLKYFKESFNIIDAVIIVLSMALTIGDIIVDDKVTSQVLKIIRSIFRFFRLFLVFRKVTEIQQTSSLNLRGLIKTPVEKIMDIFQVLMTNLDDQDQIKQLKWCIEMVSSNKMYEPILGEGEAAAWGNIFASNQNDSKKKKILNTVATNISKTNASVGNASLVDPATPQSFNFKHILVPTEFAEFFQTVDEINFDIFKFHETIKENNLSFFLIHLFNRYDIFFKARIDPQNLFNWATHVSNGYTDNFYHNKIHAFDVTQMMHYFLQTMEFNVISELSALEIGVMYMASAAHDYGHPGFNNPYLVNTRHEFAISYNDKSPLENYHAFSAFNLMQKDNSNVFIHLSKEDHKKSRERIIGMILHTDNSQHFADLAKLKGRLAAADFDIKDKDKDTCMMALLHASDVSNPFKPWDICKPWTFRVLDEFWNQGDNEREKQLPITYLCDRFTTNTSKSQAGFIDFIVKPLYETVKKFLPKLDISVFETNKAKWAELTEYYENELKKLQQESDLNDLQNI